MVYGVLLTFYFPAMGACADFPFPAHGGAVCLTQQATSTIRCEVQCDAGYEHIQPPMAYEECGPSTNWTWSFQLSNRHIMPCVGKLIQSQLLKT